MIMSKKDKKRAAQVSRSFLTEDENIGDSPFKNVVLKEKKEETVKKPKPASSGKKPSQIVQGYDPSASFKDILYNWEHTGNPYALPSKGKKEEIKAKQPSFADIFSQWENQKNPKQKSKNNEVKRVSPEYKPTKDFGSLLDQFEGNVVKPNNSETVIKAHTQDPPKATFFKEMDEDDERPNSVSWSVFGDNKPIKREEKKEEVKKERVEDRKVNRVSPKYTPTQDFGSLLSSFEKGERGEVKNQKKVEKPKKEEIIPQKPTFFKEKEEDDERPSSVAWSVFGDNKPIKREEKKIEKVVETKEKVEVKRVSPEYKPTKDFGSLLSSFEEKNIPKTNSTETVKEEESLPKTTFFKEKEEDDERPSSVAWSVFGDNKPIKREKNREEEAVIEKEVEQSEKVEVKRVSPEYKPTKDFGSLLSSFEEKIIPKTSITEPLKEEEITPKTTFFKEKEEDDERPSSVAWSVFGDNKPIKREEKKEEFIEEISTPQPEIPVVKKVPVKKSKLFNESVEKIHQKSFEDILKEKGELKSKVREKTLSELRVMLPLSTLDLHGLTYNEAESEINKFLDEAIASNIQKVAIIHGKGLHSQDGVGVLKDLVYKIINDKGIARDITVPKPQYGGSGAVWIILKKEEKEMS